MPVVTQGRSVREPASGSRWSGCRAHAADPCAVLLPRGSRGWAHRRVSVAPGLPIRDGEENAVLGLARHAQKEGPICGAAGAFFPPLRPPTDRSALSASSRPRPPNRALPDRKQPAPPDQSWPGVTHCLFAGACCVPGTVIGPQELYSSRSRDAVLALMARGRYRMSKHTNK